MCYEQGHGHRRVFVYQQIIFRAVPSKIKELGYFSRMKYFVFMF